MSITTVEVWNLNEEFSARNCFIYTDYIFVFSGRVVQIPKEPVSNTRRPIYFSHHGCHGKNGTTSVQVPRAAYQTTAVSQTAGGKNDKEARRTEGQGENVIVHIDHSKQSIKVEDISHLLICHHLTFVVSRGVVRSAASSCTQ